MRSGQVGGFPMGQRATGAIARSATLLIVVSVVVTSGVFGSTPPAGAGTPPKTPGAPTKIVAYSGSHQATVYWDALSSDGGATITRYQIRASDLTDPARGGQTAVSPGLNDGESVGGLTAGDRYAFRVSATNFGRDRSGVGTFQGRGSGIVATSSGYRL